MNTMTNDPSKRLPVCRPGLVSWSLRENGWHMVRNRSSGETFRLGQEEQFLLEQLDSRLTAEQLRAAFASRFGQPLSAEELSEFLELAAQRGLLEPDGFGVRQSSGALDFGLSSTKEKRSSFGKAPEDWRTPRPWRIGTPRFILSRLLSATEALLQWSARRLKAAQQRIHFLHLRHFAFVPRPEDIFIVTYPRSGTTWVQMILYQLTTDGSMDIPHIAEYCPWFERSLRSGRGFETQPPPRIFKSHLPHRLIPKGPCKYIYVARDGRDVVVSYYHLSRMYCGFDGTFAEFFDQFMRGKVDFGSWFDHVREWAEHRRDPNVLFLTYEQLTRDLEGCVREISAFCQLSVPAEKLPLILERCGFAFMKKHETKFDPTIETLWERGVQLNSFLRAGKAGEGALQLSSGQQEQFAEAFHRRFAGCWMTPWALGPESSIQYPVSSQRP